MDQQPLNQTKTGLSLASAAAALSLSPRQGPNPSLGEDPAVLMQMPSVVRRASSVPPNLTLAFQAHTSTEPAIHRPTTARSPSPGPPLLPLQRSNMSPTSLVFAGGASPPTNAVGGGAGTHHHHAHHHHRPGSGVGASNGTDPHGTPTHVHHPFTVSHHAPANVAPHGGASGGGKGPGAAGNGGAQQQQQPR